MVRLASGWFLIVVLLVGCWVAFLSIGMLTGLLKRRHSIARLAQPRQWEVVAGSMHREPVYPGEDDPVHADEGNALATPAT